MSTAVQERDPARLRELKSALAAKVRRNDEIADAFKIDDAGNVEVSEAQASEFRKNLADAKEIKALIDGIEFGQKALIVPGGVETLSDTEVKSLAVAAAAGFDGATAMEVKSLGELFTSSDEFKAMIQRGNHTMERAFEVQAPDLGGMGVKDVFTASAPTATNLGFGRTQRDPMVPLRQRTSRVRELFPVASTSANLIEFYKVSGFTNNAAPVAERRAADGTSPPVGNATDVFGLKPRSSLTFALAQAPVRTIAHYEVAHRNVLADEPQLQAIINNELLYGLRLEEDDQILNGDGTGENLTGILNTAGIQTYTQTDDGGTPPAATETKLDAMRRAITKVILAYYEATGFVVHPNDWEDIELSKDSQDRYILVTSVAVGAQARVWRNPVVETPAIAEGTFLTGAFGLGAQLYDREQSNIRIAEQHADLFARNAVAILAEQRLALAVKRPESFVKGTFFSG